MYKSLAVFCVACAVIIEARPSWQFLPPMPGYVPVYIRNGDTPLEEINPELAEAFHALPAGRSAGKHVEAAPEFPELADQPSIPDVPEIDARSQAQDIPYQVDETNKRYYEKKQKKVISELPVEDS